MTLHLKSRGYPFCPRLLFSSFIVVGVGFPNCVLFQERTDGKFALICSVTSRLILVSPEEIGKLHGANEYSPRRAEIKVRKNEMKLRKKDFEVPMIFSFSRWIIQKLHRGIVRFP